MLGQERNLCKPKKSIYGLKQLTRQWYFWFCQAIVEYDFTMIKEDHCVYVKWFNKSFLILSLCIDNILLAGNDIWMIVAT